MMMVMKIKFYSKQKEKSIFITIIIIIMKFLLLSIFLAFTPAFVDGSAASLADLWNITAGPGFHSSGNTMTFTYPGISDGINIPTMSMVTFYGPDCLNPNASITSTTYDNAYFTDRSFERVSNVPTLDFTMVPEQIKTVDELYTDLGAAGSIMNYCVRMGLYTATGTEVNFLETVVNITVNFDGSFDTGAISVGPKEKTETGQTTVYNVSAALCPGYNAPFYQGQVLSVCIEPAGDATTDGVVLTNINSFTWKRDGVVNQEAVKKDDSGEAFDALSFVEKASDGSSIVVSSVLYATFFAVDGNVTASGQVSLGFARRRLGESDERRKLQEEGVPPAGFDVNTQVIKATDGPATLQTAGGASPSLGFVGTVLGLVSAVLLA